MTQLPTQFINPFTDFGFKRLFGSEAYKELLIDFLNTMLPDRHHIQDLTYRKTEQLGDAVVDRKAIFDLYCVSSTGEQFIVEIQRAKQKFFKDRSIFYLSFPIRDQAITGDWDFKLSPVYLIGILDFIFDHDPDSADKFFHQAKFTEVETKKVFSDKVTMMFLELPKFRKKEDQLASHFEKWIYAFKNMPLLHDRPRKLQERIFTRLFEAANIAQFSETERDQYEDSLKIYRDMKNSLDTALEEGREEGREQGREEGRKQGRAEGREEGLAEGELQKAKDIGKKLLLSGFDHEKIAELTGLPIDVIEELDSALT